MLNLKISIVFFFITCGIFARVRWGCGSCRFLEEFVSAIERYVDLIQFGSVFCA